MSFKTSLRIKSEIRQRICLVYKLLKGYNVSRCKCKGKRILNLKAVLQKGTCSQQIIESEQIEAI